jgi:phosphate transport system protein
MERSFLEEFDHVQATLLKMGETVERTIREAVESLRDHDAAKARTILGSDDLIDNQQIVIEEGAIDLLRLEMPVSSDLRRIIAFVKIANDLERVGDYACNIAEITLELKDQEYIKPLVHIPQLASIALGMLSASLKAFVNCDAGLADAVGKRDDEADELCLHIGNELRSMVANDPSPRVVLQMPRLLRVAEYLERVSDHATNIAEQTIFISTGKRVRF